MRDTVSDAIRAWDRQFGTDDARWWAEVLGVVLVLGLFLRAAVHVYVALAARAWLPEGCDPHLYATDITLRSPVVGIEGHRIEPAARVITALVGAGAWVALVPVARPWPVVDLWVVSNLLVPLTDPAAWVVHRLRQRSE